MTLTTLYKKPFEIIVEKGEYAGISPFPTMFSTLPKKNFYFFSHIYLVSCKSFKFKHVNPLLHNKIFRLFQHLKHMKKTNLVKIVEDVFDKT